MERTLLYLKGDEQFRFLQGLFDITQTFPLSSDGQKRKVEVIQRIMKSINCQKEK